MADMAQKVDVVDVIVAGSLAVDYSCDFIPSNDANASDTPQLHTSNPASITQSLGGVGQNVATALHYLNVSVRFCSIVGNDNAGSAAIGMLADRGLDTSGIQKLATGPATGQYMAVNDARKSLVLAMADMFVMQDNGLDFDDCWQTQLDNCKPKWLVVDSTWDPKTLNRWLKAAKASGANVAYEPVSVPKSRRIFNASIGGSDKLAVVPKHLIDLASPNDMELSSIHEAAHTAGSFDREDWWKIIDSIGLPSSGSSDKLVALTNKRLVDQGIPQQSIRLLPFIPCILATLGEQGVLLTQLLRPDDDRLTSPESAPYILSRSTNGDGVVGGVYMRLFPPVEVVSKEDIVSVNGVGDTFLGIMISGLSTEKPKDIASLIDIAQRGSVMTLKSRDPVSAQISMLSPAE